MPLDVNIEKWLKQLPTEATSPKNIEEFRKYMDEGSNILKQFSPKMEIKHIEKVEISGRETKIPAFIYEPNKVNYDGFLVYFHGGGFVWGSTNSYDHVLRYLANSCNCKVASVDYRLAPENKFPAAVIDAYDSIKYFYDKSNNVVVAGDSAGGNLSAVTSILARNEKINLKGQVLIYPTVGIDLASSSIREYSTIFLTKEAMEFFRMSYLNSPSDALDFRFSPILASSHENLPPALVITAEYDPLRDQGETYASILNRSNVETVQIRFGGVTHGFINLLGIIPAAQVALDTISSFVKSKLIK